MRILIAAAALLSFSAPVVAKVAPHAVSKPTPKPMPKPVSPPAAVAAEPNKDWANIGRYRAANQALLSQPATPNRVVFMGD